MAAKDISGSSDRTDGFRKANQRGAARLAAVQALYQMELAGTGLNEILAQFETHWLDGDVEGVLEAPEHKLTIGPNGIVHATIKAKEVVALGTIQGNVEATDRIEIRKEAKLIGDIRTARIIIEDGAYFKGSIDIVKQEQPKATPAVGGGSQCLRIEANPTRTSRARSASLRDTFVPWQRRQMRSIWVTMPPCSRRQPASIWF